MIKITELRPPIKISGLTSLGVSFSFNQDILNVIKSFSPIYYHKKINMWELPTIFLPDLLDKLTFYDDIDLTLADKNEIQVIIIRQHGTRQDIRVYSISRNTTSKRISGKMFNHLRGRLT